VSQSPRLLLVGGGHSHLEVLRRQILEPHPGVSLTLISGASRQHYSGMVPGFLAGIYGEDEIAFDLAALSERAEGRFLEGEAVSVDSSRRLVTLADGRNIEYDLVSFGVGSAAKGSASPGVAEHAWTIKPIQRAVELRDGLLGLSRRPGTARVVVVGAGAGGVEVACASAALFDGAGRAREIAILESGKEILAGYTPRLRLRARRLMERKRFTLLLGASVSEVRSDSVRLQDGRDIPSDLTIWLTGPEPPSKLFRGSGLSLDARGYLLVDDSLRSVSDPRVFGAGDCATLVSYPDLPKAGVYAVREGPVLWKSLIAAAQDTRPPRYRPQKDFLSILNTCDGKALLQYRGFVSRSRWSWRLKDAIDRRFMRRYQSLSRR
jgi:selenide,water dikinase